MYFLKFQQLNNCRIISGPSFLEATKLMTKRDFKEHLFVHWSRKFKELCTVIMADGRIVIFLHSYEVIKKILSSMLTILVIDPKKHGWNIEYSKEKVMNIMLLCLHPDNI